MMVIAIVLLARGMGWLQLIELITFDYYLRQLPTEPLDKRITIVGIDDADIKAIKNYPLPDRELVKLLEQLQTYRPAVIGIDLFRDLPVPPGNRKRVVKFQSDRNLVVIEKVLPPHPVAPPAEVPLARVGFADVLLDDDGHSRRSLLGMYRDESQQEYVFSFSLRLAAAYLATKNIDLENGIKDPQAMRFGSVELPRLHSNTGGYVGTNDFGVQSLVNFRRGRSRFSVVSLRDVMERRVAPELIRERIVIVGITADSIKDILSTQAIAELNPPGVVRGAEFHAHAASQIISAVLDRRPLLRSLPESLEQLAIVGWGLIAIALGLLSSSSWKNLIAIAVISLLLIGIGYLVIWISGWWLPIVPVLLVFVINGVTYTAFYQNERLFKQQLALRQNTIEDTFTAIHNGPLQVLASILRSVREEELQQERLLAQLESLNREIRLLGEQLVEPFEKLNVSDFESSNHERAIARIIVNGKKIPLDQPLHLLWRTVYDETLKRANFPHFKTIKAKVVEFEPLESEYFNSRQKQKLAEFLEEALCNVGKHAEGATRLIVTGTKHKDRYTLCVRDNGKGLNSNYEGRGTKQLRNLEQCFDGNWRRENSSKKGALCEFTWILNEGRSFGRDKCRKKPPATRF